jgi:hypothetical protein
LLPPPRVLIEGWEREYARWWSEGDLIGRSGARFAVRKRLLYWH